MASTNNRGMTMKNADMPAMPMFSDNAEPCIVRDKDTHQTKPATGLTKREMMAMHIFSGMMSNNSYVGDVKLAVELADELLAELDRTSK